MIKLFGLACLIGILAVLATPVETYARRGDMGFFGGISEGRRLPRTTETIVLEQGNRRGNNNNNQLDFRYKELIFLNGGDPIQFEGIFRLNTGQPDPNEVAGNFEVRHRVLASPDAEDGALSITRDMRFNVEYRREGSQTIFFYDINRQNWSETISVPDVGDFVLDPRMSSFVVSTIQDQQPGVSFYSGTMHARLVYNFDGSIVTVEKSGEFYGFHSAWSASETHRIDVTVERDGWAIQYQIRPSVSVNKILQFRHNEPTVISFEGNFMEIHQSFAGLRYDFFHMPHEMWEVPQQGNISLETVNVFEQLPAPAHLGFLRGNPAEDDIHRLFAMQVLQGDPRFFVPEQAITRGQFMTALARAIKLPIEELNIRPLRGRDPVTVELFTDVNNNRPEFRYIQAIQRAGVAFGRADGKFYFDYPIQRQEAFATIIRALGLTNLGLDPTVVTPFMDSDDIAYWAIREVAVANMLGIIQPDENGNILPRQAISKGEAAALFNHLIEYMRTGLISDYTEQIVNIAR